MITLQLQAFALIVSHHYFASTRLYLNATVQRVQNGFAVSSKGVCNSIIFILYIEELLSKKIQSRHSEGT
jgi:hypothetical protein